MVDLGAQEDVEVVAITDRGQSLNVVTQSFIVPPIPDIDRVVTGENYEPYIASREAMLNKADEVRKNFLKRLQSVR